MRKGRAPLIASGVCLFFSVLFAVFYGYGRGKTEGSGSAVAWFVNAFVVFADFMRRLGEVRDRRRAPRKVVGAEELPPPSSPRLLTRLVRPVRGWHRRQLAAAGGLPRKSGAAADQSDAWFRAGDHFRAFGLDRDAGSALLRLSRHGRGGPASVGGLGCSHPGRSAGASLDQDGLSFSPLEPPWPRPAAVPPALWKCATFSTPSTHCTADVACGSK